MLTIENNFKQVTDFIARETGISLPAANHQMVRRFVSERLQTLKKDINTYLVYVRQNKEEYDLFLDAVTINETYFFREEKQFKVIESYIFPALGNLQVKNLQIWSAASSTGEEAVSIAILAEKQWLAMNDRTYFVLATDINPNVLKSLEKGIFKPNSYRVDGSSYHPLMSEFIRTQGRLFSLNEKILKNIEICQLNLYMDDMSAWQGRFHLVFLRNMLVYIPLDIRNHILDRLIKNIIDGGYLFLSSSETPLISHPNLKLIEQSGIFFFQKKRLEDKKKGFSINQQLLESEIKEKPFHQRSKGSHDTFSSEKQQVANIHEILKFANQKLNNQTFLEQDNFNYHLALEFLDIVVLLNNHQSKDAKNRLNKIKQTVRENELTHYLCGYIYQVEGHKSSALNHFQKALNHNREFWPARFYTGMLLKKQSATKARHEFMACHKSIIRYIEQDRYDYQFLLEGFNAKYFLELCHKWITKLK